MRLIMLSLIVLTLSSCTSIIKPLPLPLPPAPNYPKIQADKLEPLDQATYEALVKRDQMCRSSNKQLRAIIQSTHK